MALAVPAIHPLEFLFDSSQFAVDIASVIDGSLHVIKPERPRRGFMFEHMFSLLLALSLLD